MQLNECINHLLTVAQHKIFQELNGRLSEHNVTPIQYGVLYCKWKLNKSNPKEIAEALCLENSTISGILERMEKKGLIERKICKEDRRFIEIELTELGKSLEGPVLEIVDRFNYDVLLNMSDDEQYALKSGLRKIAGLEEPK